MVTVEQSADCQPYRPEQNARNAIVLVDYINTLRRNGMEKTQAIIQAGTVRLRPLSTTPAMAAVNSAMRLNLAAASDPGNYDAQEKARAAAYMAALHPLAQLLV